MTDSEKFPHSEIFDKNYVVPSGTTSQPISEEEYLGGKSSEVEFVESFESTRANTTDVQYGINKPKKIIIRGVLVRDKS